MMPVVRFMILALVVACDGGERPAELDAPPPPMDAPESPRFFGEPCELVPSVPEAVIYCRGYDGYCVEDGPVGDGIGICRPKCTILNPNWNATYVCDGATNGGTPTWTGDGSTSLPYVCYCAPPA